MARKRSHRLNINLPHESYEQLKTLAEESHRSMTEVIRTGLGLVKIALQAEQQQQSMAVSDNGQIVKEILIPR